MSQSSSPPDPAFSASSDINMDAAVIGFATAGSVFLVLLTIFVGYWLTTRRKRRSAEEAFDPHLLIAEKHELPPEAPRRAGRYSLALSLSSFSSTRTPPSAAYYSKEKTPLPTMSPRSMKPSSPPSSSSHLLPVDAYAYTSHGDAFPVSTKSKEFVVPSPPTTPHPARLHLVRMLSTVKRPPPLDLAGGVTVTVNQEVDSGVRLESDEGVVLPPPYTPR